MGQDALAMAQTDSSHRLHWPLSIRSGHPNWSWMSAILSHMMLVELDIVIPKTQQDDQPVMHDAPILFLVPTTWPMAYRHQLVRIAFEDLRVPGTLVLDQALAAVYGVGCVSGLVIDIGDESVDVSVVVDSEVQRYACATIPLGSKDLDLWMVELAKSDIKLQTALGHPITLEDVKEIKHSGKCRVPAHPSEHLTDTVQVYMSSIKNMVDVGPWYSRVYEPLVQPTLLSSLDKDIPGIVDTLFYLLERVDQDNQRILWSRIVLTGKGSLLPHLDARLLWEIEQHLPQDEEAGAEGGQPALDVRVRHAPPDYFTLIADRGELITLLGGKICSKVVFVDAKHFITYSDFYHPSAATPWQLKLV